MRFPSVCTGINQRRGIAVIKFRGEGSQEFMDPVNAIRIRSAERG